MKRSSINSDCGMSGRSLFLHKLSLFQLPVFSFFIFLPVPVPLAPVLYRHLPMSAHLQGTNIWETQFEHFSGTKGRQTMLEKWGDKHIAELMLDKHVALPSIHKRPCHVQRSQVWKFKDKRDGACGPCCFWVCLLAELVSLLFGRFSPWGTSSFKMTVERWLFLRDKNKQKCSSSNVELAEENQHVRMSGWQICFYFKGCFFFFPCCPETDKLLSAATLASAPLGPVGAALFGISVLKASWGSRLFHHLSFVFF